MLGGGITGAFAAYFLARRGAAAVIVERDQIGAHASARNPGGLNPLHGPGIPGPMGSFALAASKLHDKHRAEIAQRSGIEFGARTVARVLVAQGPSELDALRAAEEVHNATPGFSARRLSAEQLRQLEPRIAATAIGGLWTEGNARVDPHEYTRAVAAAACQLGAQVIASEARGLQHAGARVTGVVLADGQLACDGVVVATGPWCAEPSRWLGLPIQVTPLKGELLSVRLTEHSPSAELTWRGVGVYPSANGSAWLGGTEQRAGYDEQPTEAARQRILTAVGELLPGLKIASVERHIAGLRPVTPDGRPLVGVPAGWENVCLAVGSGRKGMLFAPALGAAAADLLITGQTQIPIEPCEANRRLQQP